MVNVTRIHNWQNDRDNNIRIRADRMDAEFDNYAAAINNNINKNGTVPMTANLDLAGFVIENAGDATVRDNYLTMGQRQDEAGVSGTTTGTAPNYILTLSPAIPAYVKFQRFTIELHQQTAGGDDININGLGVKPILSSGVALTAGQIPANTVIEIVYDGTNFNVDSVLSVATSSFPRNFIDGLIMSNGGDTDHDIDVAAGKCTDSANAVDMVLTTTFTKQIDSNWALGNNAGGFPQVLSLTPGTWYNYFIISTALGVVDFGFDSDINASNLLGAPDAGGAGFVNYRRIGSVLTDSSSNIRQFFQTGNDFTWTTVGGALDLTIDIDDAAPGTAANTGTISTPEDVVCNALVHGQYDAASVSNQMYISALSSADQAPSQTAVPLASVAGDDQSQQVRVLTNTSSQIRYRVNNGTRRLFITAIGWHDYRGQNDV